MATKNPVASATPQIDESMTQTPEQPTAITPQEGWAPDPQMPEHPVTQPDDPLMALAMQYAACYPDNPAFHITSDRQVFLSGDLSEAINHQRTLGEGEVQTIQF